MPASSGEEGLLVTKLMRRQLKIYIPMNIILNWILFSEGVTIITSHCICYHHQSCRAIQLKMRVISCFFTFYSSDFCCLVLSILLCYAMLCHLHNIPHSECFTHLCVTMFFGAVVLAIVQAVIVSKTGLRVSFHSRNSFFVSGRTLELLPPWVYKIHERKKGVA